MKTTESLLQYSIDLVCLIDPAYLISCVRNCPCMLNLSLHPYEFLDLCPTLIVYLILLAYLFFMICPSLRAYSILLVYSIVESIQYYKFNSAKWTYFRLVAKISDQSNHLLSSIKLTSRMG